MSFTQLFERARQTERRSLVEPMVYDMVQKRNPLKCWVVGCSKNHRRGPRKLCAAHTMLKFRHDNPVEYRYNAIRDRARRKRIPMTLTIDEWWSFCDRHPEFLTSSYMEVDRKDATKGYHAWNIQPLTKSENTAKGARERYDPDHIAHMKMRRAGLHLYDMPPEDYTPLPDTPDGEDPF